MPIKHSFVSGIADDPTAAAAGEVLPSHWNADHTIEGLDGSVQFNDGGSLNGTSDLTFDSTTGVLAASFALQVPNTGSYQQAPPLIQLGKWEGSNDAWLFIHGEDYGDINLQSDSAGDGTGSLWLFRSRGFVSPGVYTDIQAGDYLGAVGASGIRNGTFREAGGIYFVADSLTTSRIKGKLEFWLSDGVTAWQAGPSMTLDGDNLLAVPSGSVVVGAPTGGSQGDGTINCTGVYVNGTLLFSGATTVATLPSATTAGAGARAFVTDATATTFLSTVAGGGANRVPVVSDGTNWLIG